MLQITNQSGFATTAHVLADQTGVDTLYVVVRGTFELTARPKVAARQAPPIASDLYWTEPGTSSLKYASEVHVGKQGTDVALLGHAYAPRGRATGEMLASLTVAERQKVVRVSGDRTWHRANRGPTRPEPFLKMPLVYERAFGGRYEDAGRVLMEDMNPVGIGFRGDGSAKEPAVQPLPNLEDPRHTLTAFGASAPPASFGFVAGWWQPRRAHAGTYDDAWKTGRAPYLPRDFNQRFDNAACTDLAFDRFLSGGEPLSIGGMTEEGALTFAIPKEKPRVEIHVAGARVIAPAALETILIEPDDGQFSLSWRATLPCDKRALKIQSIRIQGGG